MARTFLRWVRSKLWSNKCERCGHEWESTDPDPAGCAACRNKYWNHAPGTLPRGRPRKDATKKM